MSGGCFAEDSTVEVLGKGITFMKDLQMGEQVMTARGYYETVYAFGHWDPYAQTEFLEITLNHTTQQTTSHLKATKDHLIHIEKDRYVPAGQLKVGDILNDTERSRVVQKIRQTKENGLYAPLTASGTLLVDKVHTSCYVSMQQGHPEYVELAGFTTILSQHQLVHMATSPLRMLCLNVAPQLCNVVAITPEGGFAWFTNSGFLLMNFLKHPTWSMVIPMGPFLIAMGLFWLLETLLGGPTLAPTVFLAMMAIITGRWAFARRKNVVK